MNPPAEPVGAVGPEGSQSCAAFPFEGVPISAIDCEVGKPPEPDKSEVEMGFQTSITSQVQICLNLGGGPSEHFSNVLVESQYNHQELLASPDQIGPRPLIQISHFNSAEIFAGYLSGRLKPSSLFNLLQVDGEESLNPVHLEVSEQVIQISIPPLSDKGSASPAQSRKRLPWLKPKTLSRISLRHSVTRGKLEFRCSPNDAVCSEYFLTRSFASTREFWMQRLLQLAKAGLFGPQEGVATTVDFFARIMAVTCTGITRFDYREVANLLSGYANILAVCHFAECRTTFVEFISPLGSQLAQVQLQVDPITSLGIQVAPLLQFPGCDLCYIYCKPEIFIPRSSYMRFTSEISKFLNQVSRAIHVSIFFKEKSKVITNEKIINLLKKAGPSPLTLERIGSEKNENMWIIEYRAATEAVLTLMRIHDTRYDQGRLRISFTKSKLNKKGRKPKNEINNEPQNPSNL